MSETAKYNWADPMLYPILRENAINNKKHTTEAESAMWALIRNRQLGCVFRRQYIIDQYITDFVNLSHKLVIEIDGKYHFTEKQQHEDLIREQRLSGLGFTILRFRNEEVLLSPERVVERIKENLN